MTSKPSEEFGKSSTVDKKEFERIISNLLKMPPKKRADSKLGTKKKQGKIIPPKTEPQNQQ